MAMSMKESSLYGLLAAVGLVGVIEVVSAPLEWLWPHSAGGNTIWRGNATKRVVTLTFDDGPSRYTDPILDILRDNNVPALFFVIGRQAEKFPKTIKRMAIEGHEIGNHLFSFEAARGLSKLYYAVEETEVAHTQQIIQTLTGRAPKYYRSPGGQMGRGLWNAIREHNLTVVYGALPFPTPEDDAHKQLFTAKAAIKPGAIVILHDGDDRHPDSNRPRATLQLLPHLIRELRQQDYKVVSLEENIQRP
jgi:peptidoglycan-N-acetylglucosamine deacetylase